MSRKDGGFSILFLAVAAFLFTVTALADWTASGSFSYINPLYTISGWSGSEQRPVRQADVVILAGTPVVQIAQAQTRNDGTFSVAVQGIQPPSWTARVLTSKGTQLIVRNPTTTVVYGSVSPVIPSADSKPFNIFDQLVLCRDYVEAMSGRKFQYALQAAFPTGATFANPSGQISLILGDGFDDPVVRHELGHVIVGLYSVGKGWGGSHSFDSVLADRELACNEGRATAEGSLMAQWAGEPWPSLYVDGSFIRDIAKPYPKGPGCERSVAASCYATGGIIGDRGLWQFNTGYLKAFMATNATILLTGQTYLDAIIKAFADNAIKPSVTPTPTPGPTATPAPTPTPTPTPEPGDSLVMEETDAIVTGPFTRSTASGGSGAYFYNTTKGSPEFSAVYQYRLTTGTVEVAEIHRASSSYASNTLVEITSTTGTARVLVNQKRNGGTWNVLGFFGAPVTVAILNEGADAYIVADAIRFIPRVR